MSIKPKTLTNKISKIEKHLNKHPEDTKTKEYLSDLKSGKIQAAFRKKPENKNGWVTKLLNTKDPLAALYLNMNKRTNELKYLSKMISQIKKFNNFDKYTKKKPTKGTNNEK